MQYDSTLTSINTCIVCADRVRIWLDAVRISPPCFKLHESPLTNKKKSLKCYWFWRINRLKFLLEWKKYMQFLIIIDTVLIEKNLLILKHLNPQNSNEDIMIVFPLKIKRGVELFPVTWQTCRIREGSRHVGRSCGPGADQRTAQKRRKYRSSSGGEKWWWIRSSYRS